jgi:hypothetical protein
MRFGTEAELKAHKLQTGHKREAKPRAQPEKALSKKRKRSQEVEQPLAVPLPTIPEARVSDVATGAPRRESAGGSDLERPPPRKRQRTDALKETFMGLVTGVDDKVANGRVTKRVDLGEIVKLIRSNGFVRSDAVEMEALGLSRLEDTHSAYKTLRELIDGLEWD